MKKQLIINGVEKWCPAVASSSKNNNNNYNNNNNNIEKHVSEAVQKALSLVFPIF